MASLACTRSARENGGRPRVPHLPLPHHAPRFPQGLTSPLIGSMAENAVLFAAFDTTYTYLLPETTPHPMKLAISGAMAGVGVSFVLTPVELIKCKLQVENAVVSRYSGPLDCIRQVGHAGPFAARDCRPRLPPATAARDCRRRARLPPPRRPCMSAHLFLSCM